MINSLSQVAFDYHWAPLVIGLVWMYLVSYKSPMSSVKFLILLQFAIITGSSFLIELIYEVRDFGPMFAILFSSAVQLPIACLCAIKYIDSNRAIVMIVATLISLIANTLLLIDFETPAISASITSLFSFKGEFLIKHLYNELVFLINIVAIGSCSKRISNGMAWVFFGGHGAIRANFRRRLASWEIKKWGGQVK